MRIPGRELRVGDVLEASLDEPRRRVDAFEMRRTTSLRARIALCGRWQVAIPDDAEVHVVRAGAAS
jgi:hypothetical protein